MHIPNIHEITITNLFESNIAIGIWAFEETSVEFSTQEALCTIINEKFELPPGEITMPILETDYTLVIVRRRGFLPYRYNSKYPGSIVVPWIDVKDQIYTGK